VDPVDPAVMRRPPRKKNAPIITQKLLWRVLFSASIIVIGTLFVYVFVLKDNDMSKREQTMVCEFVSYFRKTLMTPYGIDIHMFCHARLGICHSEPRIGMRIFSKPHADCDCIDITVDAAEFSVCRVYAGGLPNSIVAYA
jgi:Cation transporting ATPase, C-terminus